MLPSMLCYVYGRKASRFKISLNSLFMQLSHFLVYPVFHLYVCCFSIFHPVHGSSEAALDASKAPAWFYLSASRPAAQSPSVHVSAGGLLSPTLDSQVNCGCYHIPCHGRWYSPLPFPVTPLFRSLGLPRMGILSHKPCKSNPLTVKALP